MRIIREGDKWMIGVTTDQLKLILEALGETSEPACYDLYGLVSKALERFNFSVKPTTKEAS